jgi:hypothetical protein
MASLATSFEARAGPKRAETRERMKTSLLRLRRMAAAQLLATRLEHHLNDGDSPDIPIPTYVEYLNQIRDMAIQSMQSERKSKTRLSPAKPL